MSHCCHVMIGKPVLNRSLVELPAKAAASAPSPAPATKGSEAELKAQVEALKQSVAQLTQERDRLAKAAAPASAPRKEVPTPAAIDLTALAARFEPPIDPTALSTIESIIKEQQVRYPYSR